MESFAKLLRNFCSEDLGLLIDILTGYYKLNNHHLYQAKNSSDCEKCGNLVENFKHFLNVLSSCEEGKDALVTMNISKKNLLSFKKGSDRF